MIFYEKVGRSFCFCFLFSGLHTHVGLINDVFMERTVIAFMLLVNL
jgi:hypothetical protein